MAGHGRRCRLLPVEDPGRQRAARHRRGDGGERHPPRRPGVRDDRGRRAGGRCGARPRRVHDRGGRLLPPPLPEDACGLDGPGACRRGLRYLHDRQSLRHAPHHHGGRPREPPQGPRLAPVPVAPRLRPRELQPHVPAAFRGRPGARRSQRGLRRRLQVPPPDGHAEPGCRRRRAGRRGPHQPRPHPRDAPRGRPRRHPPRGRVRRPDPARHERARPLLRAGRPGRPRVRDRLPAGRDRLQRAGQVRPPRRRHRRPLPRRAHARGRQRQPARRAGRPRPQPGEPRRHPGPRPRHRQPRGHDPGLDHAPGPHRARGRRRAGILLALDEWGRPHPGRPRAHGQRPHQPRRPPRLGRRLHRRRLPEPELGRPPGERGRELPDFVPLQPPRRRAHRPAEPPGHHRHEAAGGRGRHRDPRAGPEGLRRPRLRAHRPRPAVPPRRARPGTGCPPLSGEGVVGVPGEWHAEARARRGRRHGAVPGRGERGHAHGRVLGRERWRAPSQRHVARHHGDVRRGGLRVRRHQPPRLRRGRRRLRRGEPGGRASDLPGDRARGGSPGRPRRRPVHLPQRRRQPPEPALHRRRPHRVQPRPRPLHHRLRGGMQERPAVRRPQPRELPGPGPAQRRHEHAARADQRRRPPAGRVPPRSRPRRRRRPLRWGRARPPREPGLAPQRGVPPRRPDRLRRQGGPLRSPHRRRQRIRIGGRRVQHAAGRSRRERGLHRPGPERAAHPGRLPGRDLRRPAVRRGGAVRVRGVRPGEHEPGGHLRERGRRLRERTHQHGRRAARRRRLPRVRPPGPHRRPRERQRPQRADARQLRQRRVLPPRGHLHEPHEPAPAHGLRGRPHEAPRPRPRLRRRPRPGVHPAHRGQLQRARGLHRRPQGPARQVQAPVPLPRDGGLLHRPDPGVRGERPRGRARPRRLPASRGPRLSRPLHGHQRRGRAARH